MIKRHIVAVVATLLFVLNASEAAADSRKRDKSLYDITCSSNMIAVAKEDGGSELDSQFHLAHNYLHGICREQNISAGITILTTTARKQHEASVFALAEIYFNGKLVEQNLIKARKLYLMAANLGNPVAQSRLGVLLLSNTNSEKEVREGMFWLWKASDKGDLVSSYHLYVFFRKLAVSKLCTVDNQNNFLFAEHFCKEFPPEGKTT